MTSTSHHTPAITGNVPAADLFDAFRVAQPEFSPCPLWWWSGDTLDPERLKWQMDRFREGGVWNLVVMNLAPSGPLYGHFADDPPFMSERWWEIFREVCQHARETGMRLWLYDQIGFSGANIQGQVIRKHPEHAGQTIERVLEEGTGVIEAHCPAGGTALMASARPIDAQGQSSGDPEPIAIVDGVARWTGEGRARVSLVYSAQRGFDYTSVDACAALIDAIHGEFERHAGEYFEDVIVGSFQDELPPLPLWGSTFAAEFERRHGYDIVPLLNALWEDTGGDERQVRHDFHETRAALAERAFFKPLFDWHDQRGMIIGVDQQNPARAGDPIGTVRTYADYMRTHRWFSAPGSDHHGEAKLHASLAHLHGHRRVWIESFHSSGWGGTLEETFDWLVPWLRAGANLYNPHASYYSTRGGWFEWAPPSTDWRQPYWAHYRVFADAVSRLCWLLSEGTHLCDVGVLFPTSTVQSGVGDSSSEAAKVAHDFYLDLVGRMVWFNQRTGLLDAIGVDFDVLDDESIASATIENGTLQAGNEQFRAIILPSCSVLEVETANALLAFARSGGTILALGDPPASLAGDGDASVIADLASHIVLIEPGDLEAHLAGADTLVSAPVPTLVRQIGDTRVVFVPAAFPNASRIDGWPLATIDFDRDRYATSTRIRVRDVNGPPEIWDPFTATRTRLPDDACRPVDGGMEIALPFDGAPCAVLVWSAPGDAPAHRSTATARLVAELDPVWDVDLIPTLDNRWADFTFPAVSIPMPIQQWTFERTGDETGTPTAVATFGPRATWIGPGDPEALLETDMASGANVAHWSLSRGIHKDPLHNRSLGPAGHVPEEFIDFGQVAAGQAVRVHTQFTIADPGGFSGWLLTGAAATKRIVVDGQELAVEPAENLRYQTAIPLHLEPGGHRLDLLLTARREVRLRASFALVTDLDTCRAPDRLTVEGESVPESVVRFSTTVNLPATVSRAPFQVDTRGPARILVDNREVGRQGGFLPYGDGSASQRYDLAPFLAPGTHQVTIEIEDTGVPMIASIDGVVSFEGDTPDLWLMTDPGWSVKRGDVAIGTAIDPRPAGDPRLGHLRQRPHPLPRTAWIEGPGADPGVVLPIAWSTGESTTEHLSCLVPPGATEARIPVIGRAIAWLDGERLGTVEDASSQPWRLALPNADQVNRILELRIETLPGFGEGAALFGPIDYTVGPGAMQLGDWKDLGLTDYSGMVRYHQQLRLPDLPDDGDLLLDLGDIRGSAEVRVNGESAGILVVAPFSINITAQARSAGGRVDIEIRVANTLGPYQDAVSPTSFVLDGQTTSGLFGPVRILHIPE